MDLSSLVDAIRRDVALALRTFRKSPAFTATAILSLALGLGATTAILSVVNGVLLRPLPYADANRLVVVLHDGRNPVSPANYLDWKAEARAFSAMGAAEYWSPDLTGGDNPEQVIGLHVTPSLMEMLGVAPVLGRSFTDADLHGDALPVLISYRMWQGRFGGDAAVIGRNVSLNGARYTITGVMPASFRFAPFWATGAELWAPMDLAARRNQNGQSLRVFGRLAPNTTLAQAQSEIDGITARLEREHPGTNRNVRVVALRDKVVGSIREPLMLLMVAGLFILLIACANVAHMLLARGSVREREMAVRLAIGATRARLVRQLLIESGLLALTGAVGGVLLAAAGVRFLEAARPSFVPAVSRIAIDGRVLGMAFALSAITTFLCGALPAIKSTRIALATTIRDGSGGSSTGAAEQRIRDALVVSEFALALVLLVGAGLLIRSFVGLRRVDPGFDATNVVTMRVATTGTAAADSSRHAAFYVDALQRVRALPGIADASFINHLPIAGDAWGQHFRVEDQPRPHDGAWPRTTYRVVMPGYFTTMHIRLLRGRDFGASDRADSPPVAVINEYLARKYWPGQNPVGRRLTFDDSTWVTVVGVIGNVVQQDWSAPPEEELYLPFFQQPEYVAGTGASRYMTLVARLDCRHSSCDIAGSTSAIRTAVRSAAPAAPISEVQTMSAVVDRATADARFYFTLLTLFAAVGSALAAIGIYGVISYAVARRRREIGIRITLGAEPAAVRQLVLGHTLRLGAIGTGIGIALALVVTPLLREVLFGVTTTDPLVFAAAVAGLGIVAAAASAIPARRAVRIEPVIAMRE